MPRGLFRGADAEAHGHRQVGGRADARQRAAHFVFAKLLVPVTPAMET